MASNNFRFFDGPTIATVLSQNRGQGPGFDWCRIGLSLAVVLSHSYNLSYGADHSGLLGRFPIGPLYLAILPMFFGLSGFLVTGSALRLRNTGTFVMFRALRIIPALMVEVTISALILGPLLTTVPLSEYFTDKTLYAYFGNIVGRIRFTLPGVFHGLPLDGIVNGNLWTLHPEFGCYIMMAVMMVTRIAYKTQLIIGLWIAATIVMAIYNFETVAFEPPITSELLVYYFLTGVLAFHLIERIPISFPIFIIAASASYALYLLPQTTFLIPIPMMYVIIWLGMQKFPPGPLAGGDYSYGIYLFSYPIEQTIVYLFPSCREWWILFPLATVASIAVAVFSWHFIEKPALRLKRYFLGDVKNPIPKEIAA